MNKIFDVYNAIIPEKNQWHKICALPLPTCFWANTLKISVEDLKRSLEATSFDVAALPWDANAFCSNTLGLGKRWEYAAGLFQIQEAVSMLPVHFLDPKPGERILDLCAAPGNKTAQIALRLNNTGTVIANDKNIQRMRAFGQISKRLGLINVSTSIYDGRHYPKLPGYFDKVLVDVPCSGEGTFRKKSGRDIEPNLKNSQRLQRIQIALLKKAIQLCRPGGRIVYSTCTFAPEENEAVIDAILKSCDLVSLAPVYLDRFRFTPGIAQWRGNFYDDALQNTARVWPHLNNTGGFFIAVLEKLGETFYKALPPAATIKNRIRLQLQALETRFDIPSSFFKTYRFSDDNYRGIYCVNADNIPPESLKVDATGLFFIKTAIQYPKLSTAAAMLFGGAAKKNVVRLTPTQRDQYLSGLDLVLDLEQIERCCDTGYVICFYGKHPLGLGLYFEARDGGSPRLRSLFPKYLR